MTEDLLKKLDLTGLLKKDPFEDESYKIRKLQFEKSSYIKFKEAYDGVDKENPFSKYFELVTKGERAKFQPTNYQVYHGTSIKALDEILESGTISTAVELHAKGKLISGEMLRNMQKSGDYNTRGPKFLTIQAFKALGIELNDEDRRIFGHAIAIFFASHPKSALNYTPENPEERAIIGMNKVRLEGGNYNLIDCRSEGIKCETNVRLEFGLQSLLVPDKLVDLYKEKVEGKYFTSVYPLSDLEEVKK